jgi:hypothetical protein
MKESKVITNIKLNVREIKEVCKKHETDMDHFWLNCQKRFNISSIHKSGNRQKRSGTPISILFETAIAKAILLTGTVQSFFASQFSRLIQSGQSTFYRFNQDSEFSWRNVLYTFNKQIKDNESESDSEPNHPKALIIDDSTLSKTGKRIEGVSRVHDHVSNSYIIGYKLLGLSWFNGYYARFLDFNLVSEKKLKLKRTKKQFHKQRRKKSSGFMRKSELKKDKISLACNLLSHAIKQEFIPDFVMTDTWFTCAKLINSVRALADGTIHFLGMIKGGTRKYHYEDQQFSLSQLRKHAMSRQHRCTRFKSRYIIVDCVIPAIGQVRIFFSRFHGNKKWVALVTTKMDMTYIQAIETYAIRWNIEIGFKEAKGILGLEKCQANDFDSQIAHISAIFISHAILVNCKYHEEYQSLGILYAQIEQQYTQLLTMEKLLLLFEELIYSIAEQMGGADKTTIRQFLNSPEYEMFKRMLDESLVINANEQLLPDKLLNEALVA